jgi:peptidyl-prolyl cis-trans isomerase C
MKKIVSSLVASIALVSTLYSADDFYATVDGAKITKQDVAVVLQDPRVDFDKLPDNAKKQVLEQIINIKLLAKKAIKDGIEKDKDYQDAMNRMKEDLAFQVWQKNQIDSIKITEDQKKDFYEKNKDKFVVPETLKARHILLKTEEEAKAVIKDLDKASKKEEKFIELAKSKSVGPTGKNGGDLGEFAATQMVPEFATAASALAKNSYTKAPVKTQFGYHVIYLNDKKPGKSLAFKDVEAKITQILVGNTYNKKVKELTDDLRKSSNIVIK